VHCSNIPIYIQQDATLHSLFYLETALHVSGGTTTHHQEGKQLYLQHLVFVTPLLLPAALAAGSSNVATGYGLGGPGIEFRWERDFPHLSRPALEPTQPPVQWVPDLARGKERPERDADPSPPSSAVVMKE